MQNKIIWTLLYLLRIVQGTPATFSNVLTNVPDFQKGLIESLDDRDVRRLASTNHHIRQWMLTPFILNLRIEKYLDELITFDDKQLDKLEKLTTLSVEFTDDCLKLEASEDKEFDAYPYSKNIRQYHNLESLYRDLVWLQKRRMSFSMARKVVGNANHYQDLIIQGPKTGRKSDCSKFHIRQTKLHLYLGILNEQQYNARIKLVQNRFLTKTKFSAMQVFLEFVGVLMTFWLTWYIPNVWMRILVNSINILIIIALVIIELALWTSHIHFQNINSLYLYAFLSFFFVSSFPSINCMFIKAIFLLPSWNSFCRATAK